MGGYTTNFGKALLAKLGAPDTPQNELALAAWGLAEGGPSKNNPFNTGESAPGATRYNSMVNNYPSMQTGLDATYRNLNNGMYSGIVTALRKGNSATAVGQAVKASPWGTGGGVLNVLSGDGNKLPRPPAGGVLATGTIPRATAPAPGADTSHLPIWATQIAGTKPSGATASPITGTSTVNGQPILTSVSGTGTAGVQTTGLDWNPLDGFGIPGAIAGAATAGISATAAVVLSSLLWLTLIMVGSGMMAVALILMVLRTSAGKSVAGAAAEAGTAAVGAPELAPEAGKLAEDSLGASKPKPAPEPTPAPSQAEQLAAWKAENASKANAMAPRVKPTEVTGRRAAGEVTA